MTRPKPDELDEELQKQEDEVYGTGYTDADPDKFTDTEEMIEDVIGNSPDGDEEQEEEEEGFSIADEVEKDEHAIQDDEPEDKIEDLIESEMDKTEREKKKEIASEE